MLKIMKNFKVVVLFILILTTLNSCGTVKEAFSSQKKNSTDEFLVEKKNPLKLPPDFDELPIPNQDNNQQNNDEDALKELLITSEDSTKDKSESSESKNTSLEKQLLEKIKQN